jgi:hypothetical protein
MNAFLSDLERELATARASLPFLNSYAYDEALLDITRCCAYISGMGLSSADDPISEKHNQDQYVEACTRVINWLPKGGASLTLTGDLNLNLAAIDSAFRKGSLSSGAWPRPDKCIYVSSAILGA